MSRLKEKYNKEVVTKLKDEFKYKSAMQVPKLQKIVINCGYGNESVNNPKVAQFVEYALTQITGQKPVITKSRKAIAAFKLREGLAVGCMVTLRQERMWSFLDRLISVALPRVRDFRGIPKKGFDGRGNYTMGVKENIIFPEVDMEKLDKVRGFDVTFVTSAKDDTESQALLTHLGLPFRK